MITFDEAIKHEQYREIPVRVLAGIYAYVEHRSQPGHFLTAVLRHDLFESVSRADKESLAALHPLVIFIHMEVPSRCHGDKAKVHEWLSPQPYPCAEVPLEQ